MNRSGEKSTTFMPPGAVMLECLISARARSLHRLDEVGVGSFAPFWLCLDLQTSYESITAGLGVHLAPPSEQGVDIDGLSAISAPVCLVAPATKCVSSAEQPRELALWDNSAPRPGTVTHRPGTARARTYTPHGEGGEGRGACGPSPTNPFNATLFDFQRLRVESEASQANPLQG